MIDDGLTEEEAVSRVWMNDADGLVVKARLYSVKSLQLFFIDRIPFLRLTLQDRPAGMSGTKARYAKDHPAMNNFEEVLDIVKPSILIGKPKFIQKNFKNKKKSE